VSFTIFDGMMLFGMLCCFLQALRGMCLTAGAVLRALDWWRVLRNPRRGTLIPVAILNGRLYMDATHPAAPHAVWVLHKKADRFIEPPEVYEMEEIPRARSSDGLQ
jgi:hypothetical protein